ncbi:MAG: response regulator [Pseudomonadota bacterium]
MPAHAPSIALLQNDPGTLQVLTRVLQGQGYAVEAFDRADALINSPALGRFDCLLLDNVLQGMSGLSLLEYLQEMGHALPTIFMTASDDEPLRVRAYHLGCSDFLNKPFRCCDLVGAITMAMAGPHSHC